MLGTSFDEEVFGKTECRFRAWAQFIVIDLHADFLSDTAPPRSKALPSSSWAEKFGLIESARAADFRLEFSSGGASAIDPSVDTFEDNKMPRAHMVAFDLARTEQLVELRLLNPDSGPSRLERNTPLACCNLL
jgi:hypothetical protein